MKYINDLRGVSVQDVPADMFINEFAAYLEKSGNFVVPKVMFPYLSGLILSRQVYRKNWLHTLKIGYSLELLPLLEKYTSVDIWVLVL